MMNTISIDALKQSVLFILICVLPTLSYAENKLIDLKDKFFLEAPPSNSASEDISNALNTWKSELLGQKISPNTPVEALDPPNIVVENFSSMLNIFQVSQEKAGFKNFFDVSLLGNLYLSVNMYDFAIQTYEIALQLKPNDRETLERLATLEFVIHNTLTEKGDAYFKKLMDLFPNDLTISNDYAAQLYESNKLQEALKIWEMMLAQNFKDPSKLEPDDQGYYDAVTENIKEVKDRINNPLRKRIINVELTSELNIDLTKYPHALLYVYASTIDDGIILIKQLSVPTKFPITLKLSNEDQYPNGDAKTVSIPNIADVNALTIDAYISLSGNMPLKDQMNGEQLNLLKKGNKLIDKALQSDLSTTDTTYNGDYHSHAVMLDMNTNQVTLDLHGAH